MFDARGSGWSVISLGIRAHECTLYLLLPTALVYNYRARVEQELGDKPWLELDVEDPTFHQYIEALKQWAPEGTKFVNRRIDIDGDGAEPCDRLMEVLTAMTGDLTLPPPITWTILEASYDVLGTVDMEMRKLKRWWCPRQVWVSVVPREEGNFADLYPSAPERPESERLVVEPRREEDDDSSDDSDDGSVYAIRRIQGGTYLAMERMSWTTRGGLTSTTAPLDNPRLRRMKTLTRPIQNTRNFHDCGRNLGTI